MTENGVDFPICRQGCPYTCGIEYVWRWLFQAAVVEFFRVAAVLKLLAGASHRMWPKRPRFPGQSTKFCLRRPN